MYVTTQSGAFDADCSVRRGDLSGVAADTLYVCPTAIWFWLCQLCNNYIEGFGLLMWQVAKYFGLEDSELPAIAIHDASTDSKYFLKNAKPSAISKWLDDFEVRP